MNIGKYREKVEFKGIYETKELGFQCVALVKDFVREVYSIRLGVFGGSAKNGWRNINNTFPSHTWDRIENDITKPDQVPIPGDIIFFDIYEPYNHVAVVLKSYPGENKILVLEQNTGNGDGEGNDDKARVRTRTYNKCLGWYHLQMNILEYRGVPVKYSDEFTTKAGTGGKYIIEFNTIIITSDFYKVSRERQEAVLFHEYGHKVFYSMPEKYRDLWRLISEGDQRVIRYLEKKYNKKGIENSYITDYAHKGGYIEDFSEILEEYQMGNLDNSIMGKFKRDIIFALMKKFDL